MYILEWQELTTIAGLVVPALGARVCEEAWRRSIWRSAAHDCLCKYHSLCVQVSICVHLCVITVFILWVDMNTSLPIVYNTMYTAQSEICGNCNVPVAVKTLQSDSSEDQEAFFREINLMKTLHHPNIVSFLGFCEESSGDLVAPPLMVLEYMALGDLLNLLIANR